MLVQLFEAPCSLTDSVVRTETAMASLTPPSHGPLSKEQMRARSPMETRVPTASVALTPTATTTPTQLLITEQGTALDAYPNDPDTLILEPEEEGALASSTALIGGARALSRWPSRLDS